MGSSKDVTEAGEFKDGQIAPDSYSPIEPHEWREHRYADGTQEYAIVGDVRWAADVFARALFNTGNISQLADADKALIGSLTIAASIQHAAWIRSVSERQTLKERLRGRTED